MWKTVFRGWGKAQKQNIFCNAFFRQPHSSNQSGRFSTVTNGCCQSFGSTARYTDCFSTERSSLTNCVIFGGRTAKINRPLNDIQNIDIVKMICGELKKTESLITYVTDRKGHDLRYAIDSTKIQTTLGWQPEVKLAYGIQRTIRWYLENRAWWETLVDRMPDLT